MAGYIRKISLIIIPCIYLIFSMKFLQVNSHGRLKEPPSRASMWKYGFNNAPKNYNDNELNCGGSYRQHTTNGGKCGICGDPWDAPQPRPHEAGGKYGQGVIVRKYKPGSAFTIEVELTKTHKGFFEFRLCPNNAPKKVATQECLDKYLLKRLKPKMMKDKGTFHETRFYPGPEDRVYEMKYLLPPGLTCSQCVLQWRYIGGNNWGTCANGTGALGCGPQEEFRACADIEITDGAKSSDKKPYEDNTTQKIKQEKEKTSTPNIHENEIPHKNLKNLDKRHKNSTKAKANR